MGENGVERGVGSGADQERSNVARPALSAGERVGRCFVRELACGMQAVVGSRESRLRVRGRFAEIKLAWKKELTTSSNEPRGQMRGRASIEGAQSAVAQFAYCSIMWGPSGKSRVGTDALSEKRN